MQIVAFFSRWIGFGWGAAFLLWLLGTVVILTTVQRYFLERTGSRRLTIVVFIVWSLAVIGVTAAAVRVRPSRRRLRGPVRGRVEKRSSGVRSGIEERRNRGGIPVPGGERRDAEGSST